MKTASPKFWLCLSIVLLVLMPFFSTCYAQRTQLEDVVYLKNGSIIRGTIIEQVPGISLKIETRDGNVFVYTLDQVERFTKEPVKNGRLNQGVGRKSGGTAFVLSLLLPGGGQFYNGEAGKGALMLGLSIVGVALVASGSETNYYGDGHYEEDGSEGAVAVGAFLWLGSALWSLIDAPISSARINRENGFESFHHVSDNLYVGLKMSNSKSKTAPYIGVGFSF